MRKMTYGEFYIDLNRFMRAHEMGDVRGRDCFIRISFRKYENPVMKDLDASEKRYYKSFAKILGRIRMCGLYPEYEKILYNLVDD